MNKNGKLLSFDFSKKYKVKSYKDMDKMMDNKKIDYSIEFIENTWIFIFFLVIPDLIKS